MALLFVLAVALGWAPAWAYQAIQEAATHTAQSLIARALEVGSDDLVPKPALRHATLDEAVFVYDHQGRDRLYGVVPIRSGSGDLIGLIGVDGDGQGLLWCTLNYRFDRFPAVSRGEAGRRVAARIQELGLQQQPEPLLIQGADKHLYWRFKVADQLWLVDAVRAEAALLGSADNSAASALTPEAMALRPIETPPTAQPDLTSPGGDILTAERTPAYCLAGIPYHFQITDWYCGPASLQMIMDYLGQEIGQHNIADVANDVVGSGCNRSDMRRAAHFSGMSFAIQDSSLQGYAERQLGYACMERTFLTNMGTRLKNTVYAGYPVFTLTWYDGGHTSGHYRVVKGFDDSLGVFVIHDPWYYGALSGPDLLIDQDFFVDNLWAYSDHWCMVVSPWLLYPQVPLSASQGDTFSVDLEVIYPAAHPFQGQFTCTDCEASISLSPGLALAGGSATAALPDLSAGDTTYASWDVIAVGPAGEWGMAFQAQGILTASCPSYPLYTDSIGGQAYETIEIDGALAAGWDDEIRLTDGDASSQTCFPAGHAMAVSPDGTIHLVWADTRDDNSEIYYRRRTGGSWEAEVRLTDDPNYSHSPCIAQDKAGNLHVAWVDTRDGNQEIYYKSWNTVSGWSADERVTVYGEVDCCPSLAAGDTAVYLAWEERLGGGFRVAAVYFSVRTSLGWSAPVDVDLSPARDSYRPSLAYGPDGLVHITYERQTLNEPDENERVVHKSWDGTSWSARAGLSGDLSFSRNPVIAAGRDSTLHVVWQDGENTGGDIFYAKYDGSSWLPAEQIVTGGTEAGTPSVAVDAAGRVYVAWVDHRHGEGEIYIISNDGTGWTDQIRLTRAPGPSLLPSLGTDASGAVYVVWTDMRHSNADLYFRAASGQSGVSHEPVLALGDGLIELSTPYPLPFASEARFTLTLARPSNISLEVFDVTGRRVRWLGCGRYDAGAHSLVWDGRDHCGRQVAPGVYFLRCLSPLGRATARMVCVR